jgi:hypothetical protein
LFSQNQNLFARLHYRRKVKSTKCFKRVNIKLLSRSAFQATSISDFFLRERSAYFSMLTAEKLPDKTDLLAENAMVNSTLGENKFAF